MSEECMNPACDRIGTIRLLVFDKYVGMICQVCSDGLANRARLVDVADDADALTANNDRDA